VGFLFKHLNAKKIFIDRCWCPPTSQCST